jgi:ubiquinone biosynthesis protein Coq4
MKNSMLNTFTYADFYSQKIDNLTLAEALKIHYEINPQLVPWYEVKSLILQKMIRSHDLSHIIYGCNTTLLGEMQVQFWNNFGSKVPKNLKDFILSIKDKESRELLTPSGLVPFFLTHLSEIWKVRKLARLMSKQWVFFDEERYMNITIGDIRQEFNIIISNRIE